MKYVYSTLTCDNTYPIYEKDGLINRIKLNGNGAPLKVLIKGGSNSAGKHLVTPLGVLTIISDEQYDILKQNTEFKNHVERGFIQVRADKVDPEVAVAADMETRDKSAPPRNQADFDGLGSTVRISEKTEEELKSENA